MEFTLETRLRAIYEYPPFAPVRNALIAGGDFFTGSNGDMRLAELHQRQPTWSVRDICTGLERLRALRLRGEECLLPVYAHERTAADARLKSVTLLRLPADTPGGVEHALLLSGGAYGAVCNLAEALPVAARLNALGIDCFCLNYRVATPVSFAKALLPQPLEDMAAATRLLAHMGYDPARAVVCGFSAGGHVASLWGGAHLGARAYGLPQPRMLMLAYPLITMESIPDSLMKSMMCKGMFGADWSLRDIYRYDAARHMDAQYPRAYIVRGTDDDVVPCDNGNALAEAMKRFCVPVHIDEAPLCGHGFGLGSDTPLAGWVDRALAFCGEGG